ncbi:MAG: SH3 domain-containing protein [Clostridiales bacterium]|nr:SH3 domain-containing protein [Clostridiales bacterium]
MKNSMSTKPVRRLLRRGLSIALAVMLILTAMPAALAAPGDLQSVSVSPGSVTLTLGGASATITASLSFEPVEPGTGYAPAALAATSSTGAVQVERISGTPQFSLTANSVGSDTITVTATQQGSGIVRTDTVSVTVVGPPSAGTLTALNILPGTLTLDISDTPKQIEFTVGKTGTPTIVYNVASNNPGVASVGSVNTGNLSFPVELHSTGTATIELTATFESTILSDTVVITVVDNTPELPPPPPPVVPESVGFATSSLEIVIPFGSTSKQTTVGYAIYPENVDPAEDGVSFASSSAAVSVSPTTAEGQTGTVTLTGNAPGEATVTVTTSNGKTGTIAVTVRDEIIPATGLQVSTESVRMTSGTRVVAVDILPANYNSPSSITVYADVSDSDVVSAEVAPLTHDVTLTAIGYGTATVTLRTSNGLPTKTIQVEVASEFVPATGVVFSPSSINITIPYGQSSAVASVNYSLQPTDTDDDLGSVGSSDESVVHAEEGNGDFPPILLTAFKAGHATVTLVTDGGFTASFEVTVTEEPGVPTNVEPTEVTPETPVVRLFKGDTAEVTFEVRDLLSMQGAALGVSSQTGNSAPAIAGVEDGDYTGGGDDQEPVYVPAKVHVNVLGVNAGSDLVKLTVNGVEGSVAVEVYDKIRQADVSISPASRIVESGDTAAFSLAGLDGLSTNGYTFLWTVGATTPPGLAWINGSAAGTSAEVGTADTLYTAAPLTVTLAVTPPTVNGSPALAPYTLTAVLEAHREGDLVLEMNSTAIATIQKLVVGAPRFVPAGSFTLKCWRDGVLSNVANPQLKYTSSNSAVLKVDQNGHLTPLASGNATITVEGYDQLDPEKAPGICTFDVVVYQLTAPGALEVQTGAFLTIPAVLDPAGYIFYELSPAPTPPLAATINENVFLATAAGLYTVVAHAYPSYEAYQADTTPTRAQALTKRTVTVRASNEPTWLTMNTTAIEIGVGETIVVDPTSYTAVYNVLTHGVVTGWVSANPSVLGVQGDVITGLAACTSQYVYANTSKGYRLYFKFDVVANPVTGVMITLAGETTAAGDAKMLVGEIRQFAAVLTPSAPDDPTVLWSTDDDSVATVDQLGNVTAKAAGVTMLYATSPDGPADSIVLTVVEQPVGIVLSNTYLEGYPGESLPLTYQVLPAGAVVDHVEWSYSPDTINPQWVEGLLVLPAGAAPGDYTITVALFGPGYDAQGDPIDDAPLGTDQCLLRVLRPVTSVELADIGGAAFAAGEELTAVEGTSIVVRGLILPANASDMTLLWDVEDDHIATVEPIPPLGKYARVTFVAPGSTNLVVKSASSEASDTILLNVVKPVLDFSLSPLYKELYPGESFTYDVTLVPSDTMLVDKIEFTSGAPTVANVNEYGTVTALFPSADPVIITGEYDNGLYTFPRSATVLVKNPVQTLAFTGITGALNLAVGAGYDLYSKLAFTGLNATMPVADTRVTWAVENDAVLTVDENGIARAQAVGDTWVYAYAHNGVSAKLYVSVQQNAQGLTLDAYDIAIRPGETATIHATILPADSTDVLKWELPTNDAVEEANSDALTFTVRGVVPGVATLTATTHDVVTDAETARKVCTITVRQPVTSINVDSMQPAAVGSSYPKTVTATYIGQLIGLIATPLPANAYDKSVTWSVVNPNVATIDPISGVLTAAGVGTTVAMARSNSDPDIVGLINVVVVRGLLMLSVDPDEKAIYVGDRFTITPSLLPEGSVMPPVIYEMADPFVSLTTSLVNGVTVCKVTGVTPGITSVTAYIFKGTADEASAACQVEVLVPLNTFTVKKDRIRMLVGDAFRYDLADDLQFNDPLDPATQPKDKTVVYTSADPTVASVDSYGQITAKKVGTTIINIVPNANTALRAQVTVEVVDLAAGVIADAAEIRVYPGQKIPVGFTFVPEAIATTDFIWTYLDEDGNPLPDDEDDEIAYYNGGFVHTVSPGFVNLVATVKIPDDIQDLYSKYPSLKFKEVKTSILVTVLTPVDSVTIDSLDGVDTDPLALEELTYHVGERFILGATVLPDDASDPEIFWTSSDTNIASVDAFGIVSANGTGTTRIYATSKNSGAQDSLTLIVEKAPFAKRYGATTVSGLFVRNKASLQGKVYTQFKKNTKVTIVGQYGEWYEIVYAKSPTGLAYVHKSYVRITGYADPKPLAAPGDILTESNAAINTKTTVWAHPGSGYRTTAPAGTRIMVVGSSGSYFQITYGHYNLGTGYVLASRVTKDADFPKGKIIKGVPNGTGGYDSYLIDPGTGASIPLVGDTQVVNIPSSVTAISAPVYSGFDPATRVLLGRVYRGASLTIISEKLNGFYQVRLGSGVVGWIEAIYLAQPSNGGVATTVSMTVKIGKTTTAVALRQKASTSSKKLVTMKKGWTVTLVSTTKTNGFYKVVTSSGITGYIMAKYLKVSTQVRQVTTITPIQDQYGVVNCKLLNVRELGAMDGAIIGTLSANQQVKILGELNGWYHVERSDGSLGFVKTEYITLIEA